MKDWPGISRKARWYLWARGDLIEAERMCRKSAAGLQKLVHNNNIDTAYSDGLLALVYSARGRWKQAEELEVQVMEISSRVLEKECPYTLTSIADLASTHRNQGRWKEAEELFAQVMKIRQRVLREEHPSTLTSMNNLAHAQK